jgi:hypothetical protein
MSPQRHRSLPADRPSAEDVPDPLTEAEALRTPPAEVARRAGRLITALGPFRTQRCAFDTARTSLKHLRLGPREEP